MTFQPQSKSADDTYRIRQAIIKEQIKSLQKHLKDHWTEQTTKKTNWAMVGDLQHISEQLNEMNDFFHKG